MVSVTRFALHDEQTALKLLEFTIP